MLCHDVQRGLGSRAPQEDQENLATPVQPWHRESIWLVHFIPLPKCASGHNSSFGSVPSCSGLGGQVPQSLEGTQGHKACHL